jgi:hypothetical protein
VITTDDRADEGGKLGWLVVNATRGMIDGVYHDEDLARAALAWWREQLRTDNIVLVRLIDAAVPQPDWLIATEIFMGSAPLRTVS